MIPAVPSTSAQQGRYERILQAATAMLAIGGEDMLQMKELAQRAGVSLATLYRYFPAKEHVVLAIAVRRYQNALALVADERPDGATVQERVTSHLLREFRAVQRDQKLTASINRVMANTRADYRQAVIQVYDLHMKILQQVAVAGRPLRREQYMRLIIAHNVFTAASQRWLAGGSSAAEVRLEIRMGCQLLNVPRLFPDDELLSRSELTGHRNHGR
jgi:TetR/AcrR family transcriptional regulator, cholesterol catabolism regulator